MVKAQRQNRYADAGPAGAILGPLADFKVDSERLLTKCTKPDFNEWKKIAFHTFIGFLIMGFIGFFVKVIHIPVNNLLIG
jgi:protein translocase SEC61 complex gamma subunit